MRGFTLLELLLVVAILAVIGGAALLAFTDVEERVEDQSVRPEMVEIAKALRAFRHDMGDWPRRGLFALAADGGWIDPADDDHWPAGAPAGETARAAWLHAPANLYQLLAHGADPWVHAVLEPVFGAGRITDPDTGRGFRGPYLARSGEAWVYVGPNLDIHGDGDPATGDASTYLLVAGIADPYRRPVHEAPLYRWEPVPQAPTENLALGQPYFLFVGGALGPRLLCLGPNGVYDSASDEVNEGGEGDDVVVFLEE